VLVVLGAIVGGFVLSAALKYGFDRARPDLVPHGSHVYTASFPSGHSMMAAVTYLTLAALLARTQDRWRVRILLLATAAVVTVLVGFSRVYLGVHWPTDVLAGWIIGSAWAIVCWLMARWLQRRGDIEPQGEAPAGALAGGNRAEFESR
jgi:undecaprenyl-diphosphatase